MQNLFLVSLAMGVLRRHSIILHSLLTFNFIHISIYKCIQNKTLSMCILCVFVKENLGLFNH